MQEVSAFVGHEIRSPLASLHSLSFLIEDLVQKMSHRKKVARDNWNELADKMAQHEARCILLNTGWGGGPYGVGSRISIKDTRALLNAALAGELHSSEGDYNVHPVFQLKMPKSCPGVDSAILDPRNSWEDKAAYDQAAEKLLGMFRENFDAKGFAELGIEPVM